MYGTNESMRYNVELIRRQMEKLGITAEELGRLSGVSGVTTRKIANNGENVRVDTLLTIARALSLKPEYLFTRKNFRFHCAVEQPSGERGPM